MSIGARIKSLGGASWMDPLTLTSATAIVLPDDSNVFYVSGTATCTSLKGRSGALFGRTLILIGTSGTTTFTHTSGASTNGTMDLGGQNFPLGTDDTLVLTQKKDGSWRRIGGSIEPSPTSLTDLTAATTTSLTDGQDQYLISGSATITDLDVTSVEPGRIVTIVGDSDANVVFTHTASPSTAGEMFLGGANVTITANDSITLMLMAGGTWVMTSTVS
jgi:hypothetical protein